MDKITSNKLNLMGMLMVLTLVLCICNWVKYNGSYIISSIIIIVSLFVMYLNSLCKRYSDTYFRQGDIFGDVVRGQWDK
jgi:hypothetical protein